MDAVWFAPHEVSNETREYSFTVTLGNNGKYKEVDRTAQTSTGVNTQGGTLSMGSSKSGFKGTTNQKSFQFGAGRDNQTGQTGFITSKFDTSLVKQPIRDYLTNCGWKKAGLFG